MSDNGLCHAAETGDVDRISALIAAKASLDIQDKDGSNPLLKAVEKGHTAIVQMLIEAKAPLNAVTNYTPTQVQNATIKMYLSNQQSQLQPEVLAHMIEDSEHD